MGKTILLLLDGCRYDTISENGGYLEQMIDAGLGAKYRVQGELPSMSRPMYETLMTGLPTHRHGIVGNQIIRPSHCPNLFTLCKEKGLVTAAAAYYWYSELYGTCPFADRDRYQLDGTGSIQHGIYYFDEGYPDTHVMSEGEFLRRTYQPDFLLLHLMSPDHAGHQHTSDSRQYRAAVLHAVDLLANYLPDWLEQGYQVVVTADHGMDESGLHGGTVPGQRQVALYLLGTPCTAGRFQEHSISQLNLAPLLCTLLELRPHPGMLETLQVALDHKK